MLVIKYPGSMDNKLICKKLIRCSSQKNNTLKNINKYPKIYNNHNKKSKVINKNYKKKHIQKKLLN